MVSNMDTACIYIIVVIVSQRGDTETWIINYTCILYHSERLYYYYYYDENGDYYHHIYYIYTSIEQEGYNCIWFNIIYIIYVVINVILVELICI